jgi:hypothetical protein
MPEQLSLVHEDLNEALKHLISAMGGPKVIGDAMWPAMKNPEKAGRKVADCLNSNHQQKFSPDEVIWLLCEVRKKGIHSAMAWISEECGYAAPQPIVPEDEAAKLQRQFINATQELAQIMKRAEKFNLPTVKAVS